MSAPSPPPDPYGAPQPQPPVPPPAQPWPGQPYAASAPHYYAAARPHGYGSPYAPALTDLTPTAIVAFALAAAVTVLNIVATALVERGLAPDADDLSLALFGAAAFLAYPLMLGAFIVSALWLHLARRNAELVAPGYQHARSTVWVWLGWIVPVVNLWFPFQVVRDVQLSVTRWSYEVVGWWWGAWLAALFSYRIADSLVGRSDGSDGSLSAAQTAMAVNSVCNVAALVLWVLVLRRVTVTQGRVRRGEPAIPGGPR